VNAHAQRLDALLIQRLANLHVVALVQLARRIGYLRRPAGVVAQQQQAFAGRIQTPNRHHASLRMRPQQLHHGAAAALVMARANQPARLVHHQVNRRLRTQV